MLSGRHFHRLKTSMQKGMPLSQCLVDDVLTVKWRHSSTSISYASCLRHSNMENMVVTSTVWWNVVCF